MFAVSIVAEFVYTSRLVIYYSTVECRRCNKSFWTIKLLTIVEGVNRGKLQVRDLFINLHVT